MKKGLIFIFSIAVTILMFGCSSNQVRPVSTDKEDFDMESAHEMLIHLEQPIVDFPTDTNISRSELLALKEQYPIFSIGEIAETFVSSNDLENKDKNMLQIVKVNFIPTIFHEGIELTTAYIETVLYDEAHSELNSRTLYIEEKYSGNDEMLKDFWRTYSFTLENNSDWIYSGFSGDANYAGSNLSREYLPLK